MAPLFLFWTYPVNAPYISRLHHLQTFPPHFKSFNRVTSSIPSLIHSTHRTLVYFPQQLDDGSRESVNLTMSQFNFAHQPNDDSSSCRLQSSATELSNQEYSAASDMEQRTPDAQYGSFQDHQSHPFSQM